MKPKLVSLGERYLVVAVALAAAWLLKRHYSQASAEELRWVLSPTAWLTGLLVQTDFAFRAGEGYLSRGQSVLISPACAGVNFLIVAFLSLVLGFAPRFASLWRRGGWLGLSFVIAYATTLLANALRISLSIAVAHLATRHLGLTFQSVHRLLGILVYLTVLIALCLTVQFWLSSRSPGPAKSWALLVALGSYAGITLLVPLLRGAAHNPDYWTHAAPVSVLVGGLVALVFAARGRNWDDGWHAVRSSERSERVTAQLGSR
jgi:exosortase K